MHSYNVEALLQMHFQRLNSEHHKLGMMAHTFSPSTQETGGSEGQVQVQFLPAYQV